MVIERDTIVVGGGPAGAAAAWALMRAGRDCLVLDRATFPRDKLCAGWITPEVLSDLDFTAQDYPHRFLTFEALQVHAFGLGARLRSPQHSIRRVEFDDWLLQRSTAPVLTHNVRQVVRVADGYLLDDRYHCRQLVGAGGTRCPVYRALMRDAYPRDARLQAVVLELEYPFAWHDGSCHLWFLTDGLPGYSWYVPKQHGFLNIGVGGMAHKIKRRGDDIRRHWEALVERLLSLELIDRPPAPPHGYSYYLRSVPAMLEEAPGAYVVGDAAGLATRDMCEGIGPAVRSGLEAARKILAARAEADGVRPISPFTSGNPLVRRGLEWCFTGRALAA
jgi:flavin-dependent dehydrogenase